MVDFVKICNVCARKAIIKVAKTKINSDKMCRSYSDLNFGVTFFGTQCRCTVAVAEDYLYLTFKCSLRINGVFCSRREERWYQGPIVPLSNQEISCTYDTMPGESPDSITGDSGETTATTTC